MNFFGRGVTRESFLFLVHPALKLWFHLLENTLQREYFTQQAFLQTIFDPFPKSLVQALLQVLLLATHQVSKCYFIPMYPLYPFNSFKKRLRRQKLRLKILVPEQFSKIRYPNCFFPLEVLAQFFIRGSIDRFLV